MHGCMQLQVDANVQSKAGSKGNLSSVHQVDVIRLEKRKKKPSALPHAEASLGELVTAVTEQRDRPKQTVIRGIK